MPTELSQSSVSAMILNEPPRGLVVAVAGGADRSCASPPRGSGPTVSLRARDGIHDVAQRMANQRVVIPLLPVFPGLHVGAKALGQLGDGFVEAAASSASRACVGCSPKRPSGACSESMMRLVVIRLPPRARSAAGTSRCRVLASSRRCHIA